MSALLAVDSGGSWGGSEALEHTRELSASSNSAGCRGNYQGKAHGGVLNVFSTQDEEAADKLPFEGGPGTALTRRSHLRELVAKAESVTWNILAA